MGKKFKKDMAKLTGSSGKDTSRAFHDANSHAHRDAAKGDKFSKRMVEGSKRGDKPLTKDRRND